MAKQINVRGAKEKKKHAGVQRGVTKRWLKSGPGVAKINVDASISRNNVRGASAAICRDDKGVYLGASVIDFDGLVGPECLEAHACCETFALATDLQLRRVKVATDCLAIVNHLYGKFMGSSATIIRDIKLRMRQVDESEVVHEAR